MPRWVMKMSLPFGVRSTRVRYLSSSPVEYAESNTRPIVLRIRSLGSFARFWFQSVSSTPASGRSWTSSKPLSFQNVRTFGNTSSGASEVWIQRSLPLRSSVNSPTVDGATVAGPEAAAAGAVAAPGVVDWKVDALTEPLAVW